MNTDRDFPRGGLVEEYIYCDRTQSLQRLLVYVPASYFSKNNNNKSYPVLYLQHGVGGNENQWTQFGKLPHLMDNLMHRGGCKEMLVVMGDGMLSRTIPNIKDETENWSNKNKQTAAVVPQHDQMDYIDFLLKNVIPFIDEKYKTIPEKEGRAVAGFSMGSAQASVCGFQHYELFSYIGLLSGFIQCEYLESLLGGNDTHLKVFKTFQKEDSEKVQSFFKETLKNKVFFRAMGEEDNFFPFFLKDDQFLAEHGIDNNSDDIIIRRTYKGSTHSWEAMRKILPDFLKLIF
ncbi:hypothetical protein AGDE_10129 [Angomonas deanei]|uniref:Esterase, putative n=1 Tax=Angomonas deanei TaxID=59799 RepID=A0A7G2CP41_9TRYP|nr:hypothetical protein AGDE_10129 [Angomonas deanei]CAD2221265.1 Putative esterase, putative [Angomonas deanei]|eukprot:EPY29093.1 hypothetical protein AGDE_10129 [Angomonas deanei]